MVISNWVERKLEERRIKREQAIFEQGRQKGREEGIEQGRALERERTVDESNGGDSDESQSKEN